QVPARQGGAHHQFDAFDFRLVDVVGTPHEVVAGRPGDQVVHVVLEVAEGPVPVVVVAPQADLDVLGFLRQQVRVAGVPGAGGPVQVVEGGRLEAFRPGHHQAVAVVEAEAQGDVAG